MKDVLDRLDRIIKLLERLQPSSSPPSPVTYGQIAQPIQQPGLENVVKAWLGTLEHFKMSRTLNIQEETMLAQAIQKYGAEHVELALFGARFEPKGETFDPKDYLSLVRILGRDKLGRENIGRFENYGARERARLKAIQDKEELTRKKEEQEFETKDPAAVRALLEKAGFGRKPG